MPHHFFSAHARARRLSSKMDSSHNKGTCALYPSRYIYIVKHEPQIEPDRSVEARGTIAYDRYGEEMRITEERFESNSTREFYDTFYLYAQVGDYETVNISVLHVLDHFPF